MSRKDKERQQDRSEQFAKQLLDSYFMFRSNLPNDGFFQENKTTIDIIDELTPMMAINSETVVAYMMDHDYNCTTDADGTVKWAIWRQA